MPDRELIVTPDGAAEAAAAAPEHVAAARHRPEVPHVTP
jgi:hypothetical protein